MSFIDLIKDKRFLRSRIGDMSQLAGLKRYVFAEGKAKGIEAVDVKTGSGLHFTVLPGRGMDLAWAEFKGIPFGYISKTGIVSPEYYEATGMEWLRTFFAGLLTTCGLSNVGGPTEEDHPVLGKQQFGIHGRISNMAADKVSVNEEWKDDDFIMTVSGKMREAVLHGENLSLKRTITSSLGAKSFHIHDIIENEGTQETPVMILYHFNIGYPLLDKNSRFICNSNKITTATREAEDNKDQYDKWSEPVANEREHLFFHDLKTDDKGITCCGMVNPDLQFGVYIKYKKIQLPKFTQWKMIAEKEYVVGLEPGNCNPIGRTETRKKGTLEILQPGAKKEIEIEIGVLTTQEEINEFIKITGSQK